MLEELRGVLRRNRRRSIKDYWRGKVPDLQLRWTAIRGAINVDGYAPSRLWSVRVRESEKVLMEASEVIGEVQRYWEVLYAMRPVNLLAFEGLPDDGLTPRLRHLCATKDGSVGVHQEPLHWLGQLRNEGRCEPIGPWHFVFRHTLFHGVL